MVSGTIPKRPGDRGESGDCWAEHPFDGVASRAGTINRVEYRTEIHGLLRDRTEDKIC
jgi:hypothetical protein